MMFKLKRKGYDPNDDFYDFKDFNAMNDVNEGLKAKEWWWLWKGYFSQSKGSLIGSKKVLMS